LFREISASGWAGLVGAVTASGEAQGSDKAWVEVPEGFDPGPWKSALTQLARQLAAMPAVFRFDGARLRDELVGERYEHLWIEFEGAAFGQQPLPGFSLRLAAVKGAANGFSVLPQLEFPLSSNGAPPFDGWFAERADEFGPKLELRADLTRSVFDTRVWSAIARSGQSLLLSVIAVLPACLSRMEREGVAISRPWKDWQELLSGMIVVMRKQLAAVSAAPVRAAPVSQSAAQPAQVQVLQAPAVSPEFSSVEPGQDIKTDEAAKKTKAVKARAQPKAPAQPKASAGPRRLPQTRVVAQPAAVPEPAVTKTRPAKTAVPKAADTVVAKAKKGATTAPKALPASKTAAHKTAQKPGRKAASSRRAA
jgi:hypothetical protein